MPENVLKLQDAQIFQRDNLVLSNVNLKIDEGEFVYLIGKTGSGKSSLMKTLYGDLPLEKGTGSIVGFNLNTLKESVETGKNIIMVHVALLSESEINT